MERLAAAAGVLEQAAERLASVEMQASHDREAGLLRVEELEARLADAEAQTLATLKASGSRKTGPAAGALVAKDGVALEAGLRWMRRC